MGIENAHIPSDETKAKPVWPSSPGKHSLQPPLPDNLKENLNSFIGSESSHDEGRLDGVQGGGVRVTRDQLKK